MSDQIVKCPDCGGDGNATCHNPDHGFLRMCRGGGLMNANESACPGCGHNKDGKITRYENGERIHPKCETCDGAGIVPIDIAEKFCNEYGLDDELEIVDPTL